ncbi:NADP-dependent oxidoreductase [Bryobacterales bacterium F-183]|nr:NADP-dependent oxidoreductase [Bryobacterales bacterium F-183]
MSNRRIVLASRPVGAPTLDNFRLEEAPVPTASRDGEFVVKLQYLSVDPYMRGRMSDSKKSYAPPQPLNEVMTGGAIGQIIESRNPKFKEGDFVQGQFGWQQYALSDGTADGARKVDPNVAPLSAYLGILGMPGLTAYFGLLDVCDPKPGETVLVSGAAGAVGSYVGQIAKIKGCRTIGIAGSDDKVDHLRNDLGYDAAYNYKTVTDHNSKLKELAPDGIDVYFDNVGGVITDAAILNLRVHARVAICGQISQYNNEKPEMGPRLLGMLIVTRSRIQGLLVMDYAARFGEGVRQMAQWLNEGKLTYRECFEDGIENAPKAFLSMLQGGNTGKQLVRL